MCNVIFTTVPPGTSLRDASSVYFLSSANEEKYGFRPLFLLHGSVIDDLSPASTGSRKASCIGAIGLGSRALADVL
jgi:hypothetical protein